MSKMRALKTDDELNAIPLSEPVLVELPSSMMSIDGEGEGEGDGQDRNKPDDQEDPAKRLQTELETLKAQQAQDRARAEQADRDAAEARRLAKEREDENRRLRERSHQDETALINNSLAGAQAERDAAKVEYKRAAENGDFDAMADAQSKISRAEAKILHYESGAAELAERKETQTERKEEPQRLSFEASVRANPNLLHAEKDWMIKNKSAFDDPDFNGKLEFAYQGAVAKGLVRGSPEYFDHIEQMSGLKKPEPRQNQDNNVEKDVSVSAPPSRIERGNDGRPTGGKIMLTPEERDIARSMGVSDIEYARQKVAFDAARRADPAKYGDR